MGAGSLIGAGISGAASIFGASQQAAAAKSAAKAQIYTAQLAADTQNNMFNKTQANLSPFITLGQGATNILQDPNNPLSLGALSTPVAIPAAMTQEQLEQTPGYKFNLSQGLKASQNSAAARGLGVSGAALKGASTYATGLADSTYQNQFANSQTLYQDQVANKQNSYNMLMGTTQMGANAAAGLGQTSANVANSISNSLTGAGNAAAAGINGAAAATTSGLNGAANAITSGISGYNQNQLLQQLLGRQQTASGLFGSSYLSDGASIT
jgi:hypothetical protein